MLYGMVRRSLSLWIKLWLTALHHGGTLGWIEKASGWLIKPKLYLWAMYFGKYEKQEMKISTIIIMQVEQKFCKKLKWHTWNGCNLLRKLKKLNLLLWFKRMFTVTSRKVALMCVVMALWTRKLIGQDLESIDGDSPLMPEVLTGEKALNLAFHCE